MAFGSLVNSGEGSMAFKMSRALGTRMTVGFWF